MSRRADLALALTALALAGCNAPSRTPEGLRGSVMSTPIPKPDLRLTDTEGKPFDLRSDTDGRVTLLFFGYTNCPDVCPVQMATLGAAFGDLMPEVRDQITVLFVTTDPDRDTPERLRSWLGGFDRSFRGLRGSLDDMNAALTAMKLPGIAVMPGEPMQPPVIGHPAAVVAFGRDNLAHVRYPFGMRRADWVHDLPLLVGAE